MEPNNTTEIKAFFSYGLIKLSVEAPTVQKLFQPHRLEFLSMGSFSLCLLISSFCQVKEDSLQCISTFYSQKLFHSRSLCPKDFINNSTQRLMNMHSKTKRIKQCEFNNCIFNIICYYMQTSFCFVSYDKM